MDFPKYYMIIVMVAKENYFNLPYMDLKMQKNVYNSVISVKRILCKTVVEEKKKMGACSTDKGSTKLYICAIRKI